MTMECKRASIYGQCYCDGSCRNMKQHEGWKMNTEQREYKIVTAHPRGEGETQKYTVEMPDGTTQMVDERFIAGGDNAGLQHRNS